MIIERAYFDNADVWLFTCVVCGDFCDAFHPVLDGVRYMGDDLASIQSTYHEKFFYDSLGRSFRDSLHASI